MRNTMLTRLCAVLCVFFSVQIYSISEVQAATQRFVFISHAPDSDTWWTTIKNSLKQVSEDFNLTVDYKNPKTGDLKDMARLIEESSKQDYQGMIVTLADYAILKDALTQVVKQKRMRLITVNSGTQKQSEEIGALMHIGQPEFLAGQKAGEKARRANVRSFVCLNHYASNPASHERCKGFAAGLGNGAKADTLELDGDASAMQIRIAEYLVAHPSTQAVLALGPNSAHPALAAMKLVKAKIYLATFDLSAPISEGIKTGAIAFAIDQQPYLQGYIPVALLSELTKTPDANLDFIKVGIFTNQKLNARMSRYGLELRPSKGKHINSGPALVTKADIEKVDLYSGTYR